LLQPESTPTTPENERDSTSKRGLFIRISAFGKTDVGRRRERNEDDLALVDLTTGRAFEDHNVKDLPVGPCGVLLAVCDGVGGRRAGEVASTLALETLSKELEDLTAGCPRGELFRAAIESVNKQVWEEAEVDPSLEGMATTLTAAVVCSGRAVIAHVGDSRAYVLRGGRIRQITRDQSFVGQLVAEGIVTEEEAAKHPYRNVILQAIGRARKVEVALDAVELAAGDCLLLCTDGLSEKVPSDEMARLLQAEGLEEAVTSLVAIANERGGDDNITVLAGRIEDGEGGPNP
jgi:PPM family protein phosphatase